MKLSDKIFKNKFFIKETFSNLFSKENRIFFLLFLISFIGLIFFKIGIYNKFNELRKLPDGNTYYYSAKYLSSENKDNPEFELPQHQGLSIKDFRIFRSPGFPLLLSLINNKGNDDFLNVSLKLKKIHFVFGLLIPLLVSSLVFIVWKNKWFSLLSFWIYPLAPSVWQYESTLLSETTAIFLFLLTMNLLFLGLSKQASKQASKQYL